MSHTAVHSPDFRRAIASDRVNRQRMRWRSIDRDRILPER
jgi:hypothetical protein